MLLEWLKQSNSNPRSPRILLGIAVGLVAITCGGNALAFCRTTTCDANKEDCSPEPGEQCTTKGLPLYWPVLCTSYSLQKDASPGITFEEFEKAASEAFGSWTLQDCGQGRNPSIQTWNLPAIAVADTRYNQAAGNVNAVFFQSESWPYQDTGSTLALTTVTFNTENGQIYDVDMEINSALNHITAGDAKIDYDLQSILTHEAGHFYGLAHSPIASATMYSKYKAGTTGLRDFDQDDINGICTIYPPDRQVDLTCDPTPRHGLCADCVDPPEEEKSGCCSNAVARGGRSRQAWLALALAGVALALHRARRRGS